MSKRQAEMFPEMEKMKPKTFTAEMRVTYKEFWTVVARDADEAQKLFAGCGGAVSTDGIGAIVDWKVENVEEG